MKKLPNLSPVTPGELLFHEFLIQMDITQNRLAREINIPTKDLGELLAGRASITPDLDYRLCRFFQLTEGYWLRAQALFEAETAAQEAENAASL